MDDLDFEKDTFGDITAKDGRYNARAYTLLVDVLEYLFKEEGSVGAAEILDEFRERTLDLYGPMSYTVLTEWGVKCTEDVGEMMMNLSESHRIGREEGDTPEGFAGGYDFKTAFLLPYEE